MSTHYGYETDDDLTEALGKCVVLKRLEDVIPDEDYVLHASYWWRVVRADWGTSVLYLEIAGPVSEENPETAVLVRDEGDLVVTASDSSSLQFRDGVLLDVPWPHCSLIYVNNARRRGVGAGPEEEVFGIFALRHDSYGDPYYAPVDQEMQPSVAPDWLLFPGRDLILAWDPVDVADLLERMQRDHG